MASDPLQPPRRSPRAERQLWTSYFLGALSGVALTLLAVQLIDRRSPDLLLYKEVRNLVQDHFVDELDPEQLVDDALAGMVSQLDPYSRYYPANELNRLDRETSGTFTGIGVVFKVPTSEFRVLYPTPGSPSIGKIRVWLRRSRLANRLAFLVTVKAALGRLLPQAPGINHFV